MSQIKSENKFHKNKICSQQHLSVNGSFYFTIARIVFSMSKDFFIKDVEAVKELYHCCQQHNCHEIYFLKRTT